MIKVVPFIQTTGSERFREFLATPFSIDMIYPVHNEASGETLFTGWKCKGMPNWWKFTNDDKIVLEFYPGNYRIKKVDGNATYQLSLPKTLNEFINDMCRFGIQLQWGEWVEKNLEPKDYMDKDGLYDYHINLLGRMGKSHELS
jgi:hypothetical protein